MDIYYKMRDHILLWPNAFYLKRYVLKNIFITCKCMANFNLIVSGGDAGKLTNG